MHGKPIAAGDPLRGGAGGLGVCDAIALELAPIQLPWLIDELEELRGPLEEELQRERSACAASGEDTTPALEAREYELRLLRLMRGRLPAHPVHEPVHFVGPSGMVETVVRGVMRNVAGALSELAGEAKPDERVLQETATAAAAWADTFAACLAVIGFNFDPEAEPMAPW